MQTDIIVYTVNYKAMSKPTKSIKSVVIKNNTIHGNVIKTAASYVEPVTFLLAGGKESATLPRILADL